MHYLTTDKSYGQYGKLVRKQFWFFSLLILCCGFPMAGWAIDSTEQTAPVSQLDKIENKLFQHNYAKDTTEARITRLEQTVFGETKKGSSDERMAALVKAVPNLDNPPAESTASNTAATPDNATAAGSTDKRSPVKAKEIASDDNGDSPGNYPAITAMEAKLLGKDYSQEPVKDRLARLEKKTLGAVSTSSDLSERVDRLKEATGIDVARKPNNLSDWLEDDDDTVAHGAPPSSRGGNLGFGNQDVYQDMQKSHTIKNPYSSAYVPDQANRSPGISIKSFGLSQQVLALEHEIFAKSFEHDPLPARLNRLEASVFPGQKPNTDMALPQRVQNLIAKVPIPQQELQSLAETYQIDPGTSMATDSFGNTNNTAPRTHHSLNKIINSLGNMLSGGMAGGYPMSSGNYVLDPTTGMLIDPNTGYMINPNSGTIYNGRPNYPSYGSGNYGYGASPFGGPGLGMGSGICPGFGSGFGFGGGGMSFGFR